MRVVIRNFQNGMRIENNVQRVTFDNDGEGNLHIIIRYPSSKTTWTDELITIENLRDVEVTP